MLPDWKTYPFIRLFLFTLVGMLSAREPLAALLLLPMVWPGKCWRIGTLALLFAALGYIRNQPLAQPEYQPDEERPMAARIRSLPSPTSRGCQVDATVYSSAHAEVNTRIYLEQEAPSPGEIVWLKGTLQRPEKLGEFDYPAYLESIGIHALMFYPTLHSVAGNQPDYASQLECFRGKLVDRLIKGIKDSTCSSILSALVLGDRRLLESETRDRFADTGAIHVLAVSGLHLGLVYAMLSAILTRLGLRKGRFRAVVLLTGIWGFGLMTGMSPSCVRAGILCTFLVVGSAIRRKGNRFNLLAGAALIQCLLDPADLGRIGFQLSYAAVAGIFWFEPRFQLDLNHPWLNRLGSLVRISMAAQLGTLPLSLFYFEQFPFWFWLSGIIVLPLAGILLGLGIVKMACSKFPFQEALGNLLETLTGWMWKGIQEISHWPGVLETGPGGIAGLMLCMLWVISLALFTRIPGHRTFRTCCAALMIWASYLSCF